MGRLEEESRWDLDWQVRQIHAAGNGKFLLSGGMDLLTGPQNKLFCQMSLVDPKLGECIWDWTSTGTRIFNASCIANGCAIGAVATRLESKDRGAVFLEMKTGLPKGGWRDLLEVRGMAPYGSHKCAIATVDYAQESFQPEAKLYVLEGESQAEIELGDLEIKGLSSYSHRGIVLTTQITVMVGRQAEVRFVHQMRREDGSIVWRHESSKDTIVELVDGNYCVYADASDKQQTDLKILEPAKGEAIYEVRLPTSAANLRGLAENLVAYCDPHYRFCVFDLEAKGLIFQASFPNLTPGWLVSAVDLQSNLVLACKTNNFRDPKSHLALFRLRA